MQSLEVIFMSKKRERLNEQRKENLLKNLNLLKTFIGKN